MNSSFPRLLTLLRKERGVSQKKAAIDLEISQALLSHYEKGIRECGLEFVARAADYYDVSCDYLLGRTPDKTGAIIAVEDIQEDDPSVKDNQYRGSVLPVLNKKLVANSLNIIFDILQKCNNKALTAEASAYLSVSVYTVFRLLYSGNPQNAQSLFSVPQYMFQPQASGELSCTAATLGNLAKGLKTGDFAPPDVADMPLISSDTLAADYPLFASSLLNLLKNSESRMENNK